MSESKELGIVVKIIDYDDFDQIITMITSYEVLTFIAMGVRKINSKNRIALQLGNIIEIELFRARLKGKVSKLKRANIVEQPPIEKLDTANVLLTIIKHLSKIDDFPKGILDSVFETFQSLGTEWNHHVKVYIMFKYLEVVGEAPSINNCIECGTNQHINGFEFYKGGYTCVKHTGNKRNLAFLKAIQSLDISFNSYKNIDATINKQIYLELEEFITK